MQHLMRNLVIEFFDGPYVGLDEKWAMKWTIAKAGSPVGSEPLAKGEVTGCRDPEEASKEAMRLWSLQAVAFFDGA